jgi:Sec-independent protein secretion pathway component TatC
MYIPKFFINFLKFSSVLFTLGVVFIYQFFIIFETNLDINFDFNNNGILMQKQKDPAKKK